MQFKQQLFYFFPTLFCFCLPFGSLVLSGLIVLWLISSFLNINKQQVIKGIKNKSALLLYLFFTITFISALFSSNKNTATFEVENKLSFIALPYLLFCFNIPIQIIKRCLVSFVSGCFFACLILIVRASYYSFSSQANYFFYSQFSVFIHPSYFAMYLILAIILVVLFYSKWFKQQKSIVYSSYFFAAVFGTTIFLCASKLGLISFVILVPLLIVYQFKAALNAKKIIIILSSLLVLLILSSKIFPTVFERLQSISSLNINQLDKTSSESTTVRFLIWEQSIEIIKQNILVGTTVGDTNDALYKTYQQNGLTGALEHSLNAHNQYLQTFIGLGIIGFLALCLLTFGQLIKSFLQKNFLLFIFSLLIILNFLVESMLQASSGTLFFVFFYCIFNLITNKQLIDE